MTDSDSMKSSPIHSLPKENEVAEIELHYKSKVKVSRRVKIGCSSDAAELLRELWDPTKIDFVEQFKVLLLNRANQAIGVLNISTGTSVSAVVDMKLIFVPALKANANGIIIAHNHPSGNLNPSEADRALTTKTKQASKILEVPLLDHLIVTSEGHFSFADEGSL